MAASQIETVDAWDWGGCSGELYVRLSYQVRYEKESDSFVELCVDCIFNDGNCPRAACATRACAR